LSTWIVGTNSRLSVCEKLVPKCVYLADNKCCTIFILTSSLVQLIDSFISSTSGTRFQRSDLLNNLILHLLATPVCIYCVLYVLLLVIAYIIITNKLCLLEDTNGCWSVSENVAKSTFIARQWNWLGRNCLLKFNSSTCKLMHITWNSF